jgi:hypothetical protein
MGYPERKELIQQVEAARHSRVICYVLSDRETFPPGVPGFATQMTHEPLLLVEDLLRRIEHTPHLDVFLMTRGGATESVWPLVTMLRSYADRLSVLVPFRAHSAGTLLCLGADEVVMSDIGELSPIDPTTGNQFNPRDPGNPMNQFGISVEDVAAYFELAKDRAGIEGEAYRIEVFKQLTANVHPLALGNVQRVHLMIRRLATELLGLHLDRDGDRFERIVTGLTTMFYTHLHAISRREAQSLLGDWIVSPSAGESAPLRQLFEQYAADLKLRDRYNLPVEIGDEARMPLRIIGGVLESGEASYVYTTDIQVGQRPNLPPGVQVQVPPGQNLPLQPFVGRSYEWGIQRHGWEVNNNGE